MPTYLYDAQLAPCLALIEETLSRNLSEDQRTALQAFHGLLLDLKKGTVNGTAYDPEWFNNNKHLYAAVLRVNLLFSSDSSIQAVKRGETHPLHLQAIQAQIEAYRQSKGFVPSHETKLRHLEKELTKMVILAHHGETETFPSLENPKQKEEARVVKVTLNEDLTSFTLTNAVTEGTTLDSILRVLEGKNKDSYEPLLKALNDFYLTFRYDAKKDKD